MQDLSSVVGKSNVVTSVFLFSFNISLNIFLLVFFIKKKPVALCKMTFKTFCLFFPCSPYVRCGARFFLIKYIQYLGRGL